MLRRADQLCEAEIQDFDVPVGPDHDIFRLEVAVYDSLGVRRAKRAEKLLGDLESTRNGHRPLIQQVSKRVAFDVFAGDVVDVAVTAEVVDHHQVRMVERGSRERLLLKAAQGFGFGDAVWAQGLNRCEAMQARVLTQVNRADSTFAECSNDVVVRDLLRHGVRY